MIPRSHPRYHSLIQREKLVEGIKNGITSIHGLIAQGRGEAFDYLIGEQTTQSALLAEKTAAALLLASKKPVISVNGNTAALTPREIVKLSETLNAPLEINLFHRTHERVEKIAAHLKKHGATRILTGTDATIPGLEHPRALVDSRGIYQADTVLVPLEDGDRCQALTAMKKNVIAIDLNPLSRTSQTATITIVDNVTRAIPNITHEAEKLKTLNTPKDPEKIKKIIEKYDNQKTLKASLQEIAARLR